MMTLNAKQYPSHSEKLLALGDGTYAPVVATIPDTSLANAYGKSEAIAVTPAISVSPAYTSGDALGGKLEISGAVRVAGTGGIIQAVTVIDRGKQSLALDVVFFSTNLPATSIVDNSEVDIHDTDLVNLIGSISVGASDYIAFKASSAATKSGAALPFEAAAGSTSIWAVMITRGTPTYTSTSDLRLSVRIVQD